MAAIDIGSLRRVSASFTDISGTAVDPTALTLEITPPSGTKVTYVYGEDAELVKDSTGNYHADININASGIWVYRFAGTGTAQAAKEGQFSVGEKITA